MGFVLCIHDVSLTPVDLCSFTMCGCLQPRVEGFDLLCDCTATGATCWGVLLHTVLIVPDLLHVAVEQWAVKRERERERERALVCKDEQYSLQECYLVCFSFFLFFFVRLSETLLLIWSTLCHKHRSSADLEQAACTVAHFSAAAAKLLKTIGVTSRLPYCYYNLRVQKFAILDLRRFCRY